MSRNWKLSYKWLGPYRVRKAILEKGTYILEEFDGTPLAGTYTSNRLKKFVERHRFYIPVTIDSKDDSSESSDSSSDEGGELLSYRAPIRRSARIQQQLDTPILEAPTHPKLGRFATVPPTLTVEQRREYVRYEEDDEGNLL
jgi:hypothetical protein